MTLCFASFAKPLHKRAKLKCPSQVNKVLLCHIPPGNPNKSKEIAVDSEDVADHISHGDNLGWCEGRTYEEMKEICGICDTDIDTSCN